MSAPKPTLLENVPPSVADTVSATLNISYTTTSSTSFRDAPEVNTIDVPVVDA